MANKYSKKKVVEYYDQWTTHYMSSGYGNIIQAHRPADVNELLQHIAKNAGITNGMKILDAGCGICGPAVFFAQHFDIHITALTISEVQAGIAEAFIKEHLLSEKIHVVTGDFHHLEKLFEAETFDLVIMLESFGHSLKPQKVLEGVNNVLKKDGHLYIKDYFSKEITGSSTRKKAMRRIIRNMNEVYAYNLPALDDTVKALRKLDLELQYILRNKLPLSNDDSVLSFEKEHGIDLFEGGFHYQILEPLELYFKKLADIDAPII